MLRIMFRNSQDLKQCSTDEVLSVPFKISKINIIDCIICELYTLRTRHIYRSGLEYFHNNNRVKISISLPPNLIH